MNFTFLVFTLYALVQKSDVCAKIRDTSHILKTRQKRFLIFQEGVNWVQMVAGIGFPVELRYESITWGATVKSYYLLPTNSNDILNPTINIARNNPSVDRWEIYAAIRNFMDRFTVGNGKICLLRAICEAAHIPFDTKSGILAEIVHTLLTPSSTKELIRDHTDVEYHAAEALGKRSNNCSRIFYGCDIYFLDKLTKILD